MRRAQRVVAIGAACGVVAMLCALTASAHLMPHLGHDSRVGERLAFAAKWVALAALPLIMAIGAVGNERALTDAIDPRAAKDSPGMIINGRVVDNTLEQYVLFITAALAAAASLHGDQLGLVSGAAVIFIAARLAFWIGYRIDPLFRAGGFAATFYLNLSLLRVALWHAWP